MGRCRLKWIDSDFKWPSSCWRERLSGREATSLWAHAARGGKEKPLCAPPLGWTVLPAGSNSEQGLKAGKAIKLTFLARVIMDNVSCNFNRARTGRNWSYDFTWIYLKHLLNPVRSPCTADCVWVDSRVCVTFPQADCSSSFAVWLWVCHCRLTHLFLEERKNMLRVTCEHKHVWSVFVARHAFASSATS